MIKKILICIIFSAPSLNLLGFENSNKKSNSTISYNENINMEVKSIGLKYLDFLNCFGRSNKDDFEQEIASLFSPEIKKVVNSKLVCKNRIELMGQMNDIKKTYGLQNINLFELFKDSDKKSDILRWEITYKDNTTESVITILKFDDNGIISEINEVFGEKEVYQWPDNKNYLVETAKNYLKFMQDVVNHKLVDKNDERIKTLFAPNLTKIDNRELLFENNRDLLLPQIQGFEKERNPESIKEEWFIETDKTLIIPSYETNSVTIHFEWGRKDFGKATTTAILQCNANNQIERITDVWAKVLN